MTLEAGHFERMTDEEIVASGELNNFVMWLPRGEGESYYLRDYEKEGMAGVEFRELTNSSYSDLNSELFLSTTPRVFANHVSILIDDERVDREKMNQLLDQRSELLREFNGLPFEMKISPDHSEEDRLLKASIILLDELYMMVMPVVRRLLRQGFTIYDLSA